jgi:molecular chaperone GrpE (heat shock protein)
VSDKGDKTLGEIEKTQARLRASIEEAKTLAEKSDKLLKRHRKEVKESHKAATARTSGRHDLT